MTPPVVRRDTCRTCGSRDLELVLPMAATPPGDHYVTAAQLDQPQAVYPMDLFLCEACGLAQLLDVVDPELLYRDYIYNTSISLGLVQHFDAYAAAVIERVSAPAGALVVDIGSNDGTLLRGFKTRGMRVLGVDPAREVARQATAAGLETLPEFFTPAIGDAIRRERGPAAIVTANNVFANIDDLDSLVDGIRRLLAPDGVFVFETGYFPDLVRQSIVDNIYHEHLSYYAVKPLQTFFAKHGMALAGVDHAPTKGGSIRGFVRLQESDRALPAGQRDALAQDEERGGFDRAAGLRPFGDRMTRLKAEVTALVGDLKRQGRTLAGYGASVGVTTLLYYFDLGSAVSFMVDDNPVRHERYTPGHHIPVLPSSALYERTPADVLLLAWRYAEPILARHTRFRQQGGRFIVPLPDLSFL
jgi:SAM-dependent methyltransferase